MPSLSKSLLVVCTGNICRSPTAEAVMRHKLKAAGLAEHLSLDSAGTRDWNQGMPPSHLAIECAEAKGYAMGGLVARQITVEDFERFERIFVMDRGHLNELRALQPAGSRAEVALFLGEEEIADPYGGTRADYEQTLALIEEGSDVILAELAETLSSAR